MSRRHSAALSAALLVVMLGFFAVGASTPAQGQDARGAQPSTDGVGQLWERFPLDDSSRPRDLPDQPPTPAGSQEDKPSDSARIAYPAEGGGSGRIVAAALLLLGAGLLAVRFFSQRTGDSKRATRVPFGRLKRRREPRRPAPAWREGP